MRQLVALQLRSQALSQNRIASMLGTTQASVSVYLGSGPERAYKQLLRLSVSKADADRYAALLAGAVMKDAVDGVRALNTIWTGLLGLGAICPAHRELYTSLSGCEVCTQLYGSHTDPRSRTIAEVAEAVKMLEGSPKFVAVMPEVSVNLACVSGEASGPADVVAVPGRIVKVKDRAKAMLPPEAGASAHMAKVLLLARSGRPELRACINLRYDSVMAEEMKRAGLRTLSIGRHSYPASEDSTVEALSRKLKSSRVRFDAIVDEGGSGIEPNVYLFAEGAREAAALALRLAVAYSAG